MNAPIRIATSLRNAPGSAMTREELEAECRRAWQERGVVVLLNVAAIPNEFERAAVIGEATRLYGRRMKR